jgi:hypothetical protein
MHQQVMAELEQVLEVLEHQDKIVDQIIFLLVVEEDQLVQVEL